jgi:hypothetical protein
MLPQLYLARVLFTVIVLATLLIHIRSLLWPVIYWDDFDLLLKTWTWAETRRNLWVPMNEHSWPLTRLWTFAIVCFAGDCSGIPRTCAIANRLLLLATIALVYHFVRRERGHPAPALVCAATFGVTSAYQEAVFWFAAGPAIASVATGLLGLLAAQRWRQAGGFSWLIVAAVWSALAPCWFAGGLLAGPLCSLYLMGHAFARWRVWLVPVFGSVLFLSINLSLSGDRILNAEHYQGKTAIQAFDPISGAWNTIRVIADCWIPGAVGLPPLATFTRNADQQIALPIGVVLLLVATSCIALIWCWRRAGDRRLIVLGLGFVFSSYWLIQSARVGWDYARLTEWSRYGVFPQMGLALILAGVISTGYKTPFTRSQAKAVALFIGILTLLHLPRGICNSPMNIPEQAEVLLEVDRVDERCRALGVSAADARSVLSLTQIPGGDQNRWDYLRGSNQPQKWTATELAELRSKLLP